MRAAETLASSLGDPRGSIRQISQFAKELAVPIEEVVNSAVHSLRESLALERAVVAANERSRTCKARIEAVQGILTGTVKDLERLAKGINQSLSATLSVGEGAEVLKKLSGDTGRIVETVLSLANQINLLALNAVIEATRAGKHGQAFSVVAAEIQNLAEASRHAAETIASLVDEIQGKVESVIGAAEDIVERSRGKVVDSRRITEHIAGAEKEMATVATGGKEIDDLAENAQRTASEMRSNIEQLASAVEELSTKAGEVSAATAEGVRLFAETSDAAEQLRSAASRGGGKGTQPAREVGSALEKADASLESATKVTERIGIALEEIASTTETQAAVSGQAEAGAGKLRASISEVNEKSLALQEKVKGLQDLISRDVTGNLQAIRAGLEEAVVQNRECQETIRGLEGRIRAIDRAANEMFYITFQTNQLAVNGSIEAVRAGEFGKGFAQVAQDVRDLARESFKATETIRDLVPAIQQETQGLTIALAAAEESVGRVTLEAEPTIAQLHNLGDHLGGYQEQVQERGKLISAMARFTRETASQIESAAAVSHTVSLRITSARAAARGSTARMTELRHSFEQLKADLGTIRG